MKISKLCPSVRCSLAVSVVALLLFTAMSQRAHAFGGLWSSRAAPIKQSAEQIIFVDNPDATVTAIIQIEYAGPSQEFAWVIPMPGKPKVGVSSRTVFQRLDAATAPQYWVAVAVKGMCMQQGDADAGLDAGSDAGSAPSDSDAMPTSIVVIDQGSVGPYDYATIMLDPTLSDPAQVATDWFTNNGYDLTSLDDKVLSPYLADGLNLLAFKLTEGTDVGAIRPVVLTYDSELPMIPLRPTAVAAQDDMGIQVWVLGPSQAVPDNYKSLVINEARIDWLSGREYRGGTLPSGGAGPFDYYDSRPSNYDAVVSAAADEAGGRGFVTELGAPASQFRDKVWSPLNAEQFATMSKQSYADGIDAVLAASGEYGGWDGWKDALEGAITLPAGVTLDEFGRNPDQYRDLVEVDTSEFFRLLDEGVVKPVADAAAMLYNAPYLTRLYSTMSADEMTVDPGFNYNSDLAQVSNIHIAKQLIQCSSALNQPDAPWRIELPHGGVIEGKGSAGWPVTEDSMPANLKIVMLSTRGSGTVIKDNSEEIGMKLFKSAGPDGSGVPVHAPQTGLLIGGTQSVRPHSRTDSMPSIQTVSGGSVCSATHVGAGTGTSSTRAAWLPLAGVILALRRRRSP